MGFNVKVGNFAQPTTTNASFGVTGIGFTPKVIILFATDETAVGTSTNWTSYFGMATSTTNRVGLSDVNLTAGGTTGSRSHDITKCFLVVSTAGTTLVAADLVSFDADGFTLNFSTVDAKARIVGYIALGGSDLTNAFIKQFTPAASNADQAFTGVGFKPDAMILASAFNGNTPPSNEALACQTQIGFATATNQQVAFVNPNGSTESIQVAKILEKSSSGGAITCEATLKTFDADGFTLNFTVSSSNKIMYALCLKGGQYKVGVFNQATGTGNQSVTGLAFQPQGVLLASINKVSSASLQTTLSNLSFGAASSSTSRMGTWSGGGNTGVQDNNTDTGKIMNMLTAGASPTTNTSADFVSLNGDGFTINNTSVDATAREIMYMVFGSNANWGKSLNVNQAVNRANTY